MKNTDTISHWRKSHGHLNRESPKLQLKISVYKCVTARLHHLNCLGVISPHEFWFLLPKHFFAFVTEWTQATQKASKEQKKIEKTKRERLTKNKKRSELEVNEGIERESCAEHTHQWINQTKWRLIMKTQGKTDSDLDHPRSKIFRMLLAYRT